MAGDPLDEPPPVRNSLLKHHKLFNTPEGIWKSVNGDKVNVSGKTYQGDITRSNGRLQEDMIRKERPQSV